MLIGAAIAATLWLAACGGGEGTGDDAAGAKATSGRADCASVEPDPEALRAAVEAAPPGNTICLADGSHGEISLDASKPEPGVTVRAQHPGKAEVAGASLQGSNLTLSRFDVGGEITVEPGSTGMTVDHNRISRGYFGVNAGPTSSTQVNDVAITGNRFVGPFGEDAIRLNRYHDGPDPDLFGILIEGNEITNVRENGNHSDCLQTAWVGDHLYFHRNYLHDNRCQGFFVSDQASPIEEIVVDDNLFLRNAAPCDPPGSGCGPPSILQMFGPTDGVTVTRNTVWTAGNGSPLTLREGPFGAVKITDNVIYRVWSDWDGGFPEYIESNNTICRREGTFPATGRSSTRSCSPAFVDPAGDDFRLRQGGAGVTWRPADQHFGP
jgi:Right handed beta helix region